MANKSRVYIVSANSFVPCTSVQEQSKENLNFFWKKNPNGLKITTDDLKSSFTDITIMPISRDYRANSEEENEIIIDIPPKSTSDTNIITGKYAGFIVDKDYELVIESGYSEKLLIRMLDSINQIFVSSSEKNVTFKGISESMLIIEYLFLSSLQKAMVSGFPLAYTVEQKSQTIIKGKINVSQYISREMARSVKISQSFRALLPVQYIIDVIYCALLKTHLKSSAAFSRLKSEIAPMYSGSVVDRSIITKAINHPVLNNPVYASFQKVLVYAEKILMMDHAFKESEGKGAVYGFLFNITDLWELYLKSLLSRSLPDWEIIYQADSTLFVNNFFRRHMYPDIVLKNRHTGKYAVFDAKFKKMDYKDGRDLDREDLYQVSFYGGHYSILNSQNNDNAVTVCGLIYPVTNNHNISLEERSSFLFGLYNQLSRNKFVVTGIYVGKKDWSFKIKGQSYLEQTNDSVDLIESESVFIEEIKDILSDV